MTSAPKNGAIHTVKHEVYIVMANSHPYLHNRHEKYKQKQHTNNIGIKELIIMVVDNNKESGSVSS